MMLCQRFTHEQLALQHTVWDVAVWDVIIVTPQIAIIVLA